MKFTVELSDLEMKGMEHVAYDVEEWINNVVHERARVAIDELMQEELKAALEEGRPIGQTKEEIVMNSNRPNAQARHASMVEQMQALVPKTGE